MDTNQQMGKQMYHVYLDNIKILDTLLVARHVLQVDIVINKV
jgi:hypothetical protein